MKIELIPVIEINFHSEQIQMPEKGPYWEFENEWEDYKFRCLKKAGFSEKIKAIKKGSSLFRVSSIPNKDFPKIIENHFEELFDEDEIVEEEISSLDGGYVLKINDNHELFPQCCGTLKDINEWKNIYEGKDYFWIGHPFPKVIQNDDTIILECLEKYVPPAKKEIELKREKLQQAISNTINELNEFSKSLNEFAPKYKINNLGDLLIYGKKEACA